MHYPKAFPLSLKTSRMRRDNTNYGEQIGNYLGFYVHTRREHKPMRQQFGEALALARCYRYFPYHYVKHFLFLESFAGNVCDFIPPVLLRRFIFSVNPEEVRINVHEKARFADLLQAAGIACVPILATVERNGRIHDQRGCTLSYVDFLRLLTSTGRRTFFIKPTLGVNGRCVFRADVDNDGRLELNRTLVQEETFFRTLFAHSDFETYIAQPQIRQHRVLDEINPTCVNTVRIDTYIRQGAVVSNGAVLRVGSGRTHTDNWSTGGFIVPVDLTTGRLGATAQSRVDHGRRLIDKHPITGARFAALTLPYWTEVRAVVEAAARAMKPLTYLGWDIAIGEEGPVVIEANHPSGIYLMQEGVGGMRNTPLGEDVINCLGGAAHVRK